MPQLSEEQISTAHSVDFPGCFGKWVDSITSNELDAMVIRKVCGIMSVTEVT
jgi:hypothetical protein